MRAMSPAILAKLGQIIEANGSGALVEGYPREFLLGAGLCRPTPKGLVHTPQGLIRYRKEARAAAMADRRRHSAQALDNLFRSSPNPSDLFREILRTGRLPHP